MASNQSADCAILTEERNTMSERIKVRIYATQRVHYSQVVEMTVDDFKVYESMCEHDDPVEQDLAELVDCYIDMDDASDADRFEDVEITPVGVSPS